MASSNQIKPDRLLSHFGRCDVDPFLVTYISLCMRAFFFVPLTHSRLFLYVCTYLVHLVSYEECSRQPYNTVTQSYRRAPRGLACSKSSEDVKTMLGPKYTLGPRTSWLLLLDDEMPDYTVVLQLKYWHLELMYSKENSL